MGWVRRLLIGGAGLFGLGAVATLGYVGYALGTAESRLSFPDTPYPGGIVVRDDPVVIERGRYLFHGPAHCAQCHGSADRAHPEGNTADLLPTGGLRFDDPMGTTFAANLTPDPATGIGARTDAELARAVRAGVLADGRLSIFMAYSVGDLSDEDLGAVLSYLRSLPPVANGVPQGTYTLLGKLLLPMFSLGPKRTPGAAHVPPADAPSLARGAYLVESVAVCLSCHSEVDLATFRPTPPLGGGSSMGQPSPAGDGSMFYTPNLTSHPTGITGRLDEDAFVARMRAGRVYPYSIMPWEQLSRMTDADLRSVYRYLRSLPPVDRDVGPTFREG